MVFSCNAGFKLLLYREQKHKVKAQEKKFLAANLAYVLVKWRNSVFQSKFSSNNMNFPYSYDAKNGV